MNNKVGSHNFIFLKNKESDLLMEFLISEGNAMNIIKSKTAKRLGIKEEYFEGNDENVEILKKLKTLVDSEINRNFLSGSKIKF